MQYIDNNPMEKNTSSTKKSMRKIVNFTQKRSLIIYWMLLKILVTHETIRLLQIIGIHGYEKESEVLALQWKRQTRLIKELHVT